MLLPRYHVGQDGLFGRALGLQSKDCRFEHAEWTPYHDPAEQFVCSYVPLSVSCIICYRREPGIKWQVCRCALMRWYPDPDLEIINCRLKAERKMRRKMSAVPMFHCDWIFTLRCIYGDVLLRLLHWISRSGHYYSVWSLVCTRLGEGSKRVR